MSERRFRMLARELRRRGVAGRHARRAELELNEHYGELLAGALSRGEPLQAAAAAADRALGSDATLIERYASRRELRSRLYRWPVLCTLVPLAGFGLLCVGTMAALVWTLRAVSDIHPLVAPAWLALAVNSSLVVSLQWVLPLVLAGAFTLFARRRHVALGWLLAGAVLECLMAQQMNFGLSVPTAGRGGSASMGIGFRSATFPTHLVIAFAMAALALAPYLLATRRSVDRAPSS